MKALVVAGVLVAVAAPRAAHAKGCHEVSDVVGLEHCRRFGMWSREYDIPRLWLDIGYFSERFQSQPFTLGAAPLATTQHLDESTGVSGVSIRFLGGIGHAFYTGFELLPGGMFETPQTLGVQPTYGMMFGLHGIAGVHVERFRLALAAELAPGFRYVSLVHCTQGTSCKGDNAQSDDQARLELQGRLRLDFYLHPNLAIGAAYGKSLVDADDRVIMFTASIHVRAMDGMY